MALVRLARVLSSSNSELFFAALAPSPFRSWFGVTYSVASWTLCVWLSGLAGRKSSLLLGFVDVLLQPILAGLRFVVTVDGGASTFVSDGPAPAARIRSRRILAVAPMADHDWPSSLLPHGFVSDVSRKLCMTWLLCVHWISPHWHVVSFPFLSGETRFSS